MVSGNPYISTNSATMNAENALKERQSRSVRGFVKLKAKIIKIAELMMTSDHNPYAGASSICCPPICGLAMIVMLAVPSTMATMPTVHEQMQKGTKQQ